MNRYLNQIFFVLGLHTGRKSKWCSALNWTFFFINITVNLMHFYVCYSYVQMVNSFTILIAGFTNTIVSLCSYTYLRWKLNAINKLLKKISGKETSIAQSKKIFGVLWISVHFVNIVIKNSTIAKEGVMIVFQVDENAPYIDFYRFFSISLSAIYADSWTLNTSLLYIYVLMASKCATKQFTSQITRSIANLSSRAIRTVRIERHEHLDLKEKLHAIISPSSFAWFAQLYIALTTNLIVMSKYREAMTTKNYFAMISPLVINSLILFFTVEAVERIMNEETRMSKALLESVSNLNMNTLADVHEQNLLINELRDNLVVTPNAWRYFEINRTTLLSFIGSVIPFAVMARSLTFEKY